MIALLSALFLLANAELTNIYKNGAFTSTVGLYDPGLSAEEKTMRVYFNPPRCLQKFAVDVSEQTPVIVQTVSGHKDGKYIWTTIGSTVLTPEQREIEIEDAPHCASRFRITIEKGVFQVVDADAPLAENNRKRAISCTYSATSQWPNTCKSSSAGTKCLNLATPNYCGCADDGDCFADVSHPFCNVAGDPSEDEAPGTCVKCQYVPGTTTVPQQGYACRMRYPSKYYADNSLVTGTTTPGFSLVQFNNGEQIPLDSYFKEVCISGTNSGACERCDQASALNAPDYGLTFPNYASATPTMDVSRDGAFQDGLRGSYFCKNVYGPTSPHPQRPICISSGLFTAAGIEDIFTNYVLSMEIGQFGTGTESIAPGAPTPTDPSQAGIDTLRLIREWEGACGPCVLQSALTGGVTTRLHTICSYTQATTPICDATVGGGCRACASNADCGLQTASCLTDGSGSCTGGANCQANGSCRTCVSDADCGALDGGETAAQARCDVTTGICVDAFFCGGNIGERSGAAAATDCSAANGGNNCQKDGTCITCTSNADCGNLDGGTTQNQQVCNRTTGICGPCSLNADCVGASGANCQKDGTCVDCTTSPSTVCGTNDGGAGTGCTAGVFCADANDQSICNAGTRICEPPCLSNAWCSGKKTAQPAVTTNNGANCGSNGVCADCQTPGSPSTIANSPNCGTVDGPPTGLTGTSGAAGQTSCDPSGICVDPFSCTTNPSCSGAPAAPYTCTDTTTSCANCQVGGSCLPCVVDYTTSTCGSLDAGEIAGQVNCRTASRQCVAACTSSDNTGCAGTQGANCMANGVCHNCRDDSDCRTGNAWGGDLGGQTVCISTICTTACASNTVCGANSNCMKDGRCTPCTNDADCVANDGPPPMGTDIKCNSGVCIPPYECTSGSTPADNNGCRTNTGSNNCMADRTCKTCTQDSDCIGDGGFKPNQPKCDVATGTCVDCGSNADCLGTGTPLNCDDDGLCRDCRTYPTGVACNTRDGPAAGLPTRNPNCDTLTGICVDFCTKDADCPDACAPKCQLERGCCVECLAQTDCPVPQWRGAQRSYTFCTTDYICTLPPTGLPSTGICDTDADCSGSTPACDYGRQVCVQCLADAHCNRTTGTPACHIGARRCVDCTDDSYCVNDRDEDGNPKVCGSNNVCEVASSGFVSISLFSLLLLALMRLL